MHIAAAHTEWFGAARPVPLHTHACVSPHSASFAQAYSHAQYDPAWPMPLTHLPCGRSLQSASELQFRCFSVPPQAGISMTGSHVVTLARCTLPLLSAIHPFLDEMTGMPSSDESVDPPEVVDDAGSIVTTDVDSPDDDACEAPAHPGKPRATKIEMRSESRGSTKRTIAQEHVSAKRVCSPRTTATGPAFRARSCEFFLGRAA